ncbi:MAG: TlpA disulfide reductase family protein [Pseudomonadota bacterium]
MNDKANLTGLAALLLLLCLGLPGATQAGLLDPYQDLDDVPPAFELEDLGHTTRSLQEYRGQVVLVNFWASWCGPCLIEMPSLQRLQQAMDGKPFAILAVNVGETHGKVWNFASRLKLTFPMLLDAEGATAADWQVTFYPTTFLIDGAGRIRYVAYGPRGWDSPEMIQAIEAMFDSPPATGQQAGIEAAAVPD